MTDAIEEIKANKNKVQAKIDESMADPAAKAKLQEARAKMNQLKSSKSALIEQKKALRAQLDQTKNQADKIVKDKKDAKSNIKFSTLEEIEAEVAKLKRKQETTTMTLNEEKKLIKEMDALMASKKFVVDLKSKDSAMDSVKEQRKSISVQIGAKDKEIDAVSKDLDETMATIKELNDAETKKREAIQEYFKERDEYKKAIGVKIKEKDAIRDEFRKQNNEWFNYQRAIRAQKKMQYEEEKKKREEEDAAYRAKLEAEEAKKIPYEEEQALCDYLADYLERTYLGKPAEGKETKKEDVVAVKEDPFAGLKPVNKKDEEVEFFSKGKGKKKRNRQAKKQDSVAAPFNLSVDLFEQFSLIGLVPPTSLEAVEGSVKELREKKEWYKVQPRNSVPTAAAVRKAREQEAAKLRQATERAAAATVKSGKGGFSLSDDDFAPLGAGGAASSVNSSWGQKPSAGVTTEGV